MPMGAHRPPERSSSAARAKWTPLQAVAGQALPGQPGQLARGRTRDRGAAAAVAAARLGMRRPASFRCGWVRPR